MDSCLVLRSYWVILNQWTKWNNRSFKKVAQNVFQQASSHQITNLWRFADRCNIPWNRPTNFQTWLQQYRGAFLYSAQCSFSNPICFWFVWCWRTMNPGKIFTSFAEFQGIVSVNDFRLPIWHQELLQPLCVSWESFCFARIRLDPLGGQVLHLDCISMIVSKFKTFTENFVICCYQVTKIFCTRYGSAIASSARCPCNFGPLTDLAISVFREMSLNTVLAQILTSLGCGL